MSYSGWGLRLWRRMVLWLAGESVEEPLLDV
jgi:hypothetical protein